MEDYSHMSRLELIQEIKRLKKTETELKGSEQKFKALFEGINDAVFVHPFQENKYVNFIEVNQVACQRYGYSKEEFLELTPEDITTWKTEEQKKSARENLKQNDWWVFETEQTTKTGKMIPVEISSRIFDIDEQAVVMSISRDITEWKETEKTLSNSSNFLNTIIDSSPFSMWVSDTKGKVIRCNTALCKSLNLKKEQIINRYNVFNDTNIVEQGLMQQVESVFKGKKQISFTLYWKPEKITGVDFSKSDTIWINVSMIPILDTIGNLSNVVCQWVDISNQKKSEIEINQYKLSLEKLVKQRTLEIEVQAKDLLETQMALRSLLEDNNEARVELRTTNKDLETLNKDLEAFAYSISHDLRAPLRHIDGFTRLLREELQTGETTQLEYFDKITSAIERMSQMIDSLLKFSRLGRKTIHSTKISTLDIINKCIEQLQETTKHKIIWNISTLPHINGDPSLIQMIFENLISNAVKFSSKNDEIIITIGYDKQSKEFFVNDNGVGFKMEYTDKLFGVFQRLHTQAEFEGTGIGLANVKQIVKKHGGTIRAFAAPNQGATFYFSLPIFQPNNETTI